MLGLVSLGGRGDFATRKRQVAVKRGAEFVVYIKGSYEKAQATSKPESVFANYGEVTDQCAKDGYHVLGVTTKTLPAEMEAQLVDITRDQVEGD